MYHASAIQVMTKIPKGITLTDFFHVTFYILNSHVQAIKHVLYMHITIN